MVTMKTEILLFDSTRSGSPTVHKYSRTTFFEVYIKTFI